MTRGQIRLLSRAGREEVAARLARHAGLVEVLGCTMGPPTWGGITRARERLGFEPLRDIFARVAAPVADQLTRGAFLGPVAADEHHGRPSV